MMRSTYADNIAPFAAEAPAESSPEAEEQALVQSPAQQLLYAAFSVLTLLGPRAGTLLVLVLASFVLAALILGLTAAEATAASRWVSGTRT